MGQNENFFFDELGGLDERLPERDCFFISADRHDRDRIEIQLGFDGLVSGKERSFSYDVEFLVFCPKSLGLLEVEGMDHLRQEFQSYVRLHTHTSDPKSNTSQARVLDRFDKLRGQTTIENLRLFAVDFEAYAKAITKRLRKLCQKNEIESEFEAQVRRELYDCRDIIQNYRRFHENFALNEAKTSPAMIHDMDLLDEYISHLYVQLLGTLSISSLSGETKKQIRLIVTDLAQKESQLRADKNFLIEQRSGPDSSAREDLYLRRISLLKKFFQKQLFVHVSGTALEKRLLLPISAMSAALAASAGVFIQFFHWNSTEAQMGLGSVTLVSVAVIAYVTRDMLKDSFRKFFYQKSSRWFPEYEKKLFVEREGKRIKLGTIKEHVRTFDSERLPADMKAARYSVEGGEIEESLHEDILFFKKRVTLDLSELDNQKEFPWGLREIVRYRFDRLMTSMEDSFKNLYLLSKSGTGSARQGHRVYHIHVATWINRVYPKFLNTAELTKPAFKAYRVTLDKTGVLSCERAKWVYKKPPAPPPDH